MKNVALVAILAVPPGAAARPRDSHRPEPHDQARTQRHYLRRTANVLDRPAAYGHEHCPTCERDTNTRMRRHGPSCIPDREPLPRYRITNWSLPRLRRRSHHPAKARQRGRSEKYATADG